MDNGYYRLSTRKSNVTTTSMSIRLSNNNSSLFTCLFNLVQIGYYYYINLSMILKSEINVADNFYLVSQLKRNNVVQWSLFYVHDIGFEFIN